MPDIPLDQSSLAGEVHELGCVAAGLDDVTVFGNVGEGCLEVEVLECAAALHLGSDLSRDRQDRGAIDLGVVQPGEQIGRTGARYAETGG